MNTIQNVNTNKPTENKSSQPGFQLGNSITDYFAAVNNLPANQLAVSENGNGLRSMTMDNELPNDQNQESLQNNSWNWDNGESANSQEISTTTEMTSDFTQTTKDLASTSDALGPMIVASSITSGLIHANNQERDVNAQRSPNFDAQHIAGLQDARDETVGEVGMLGTAALGAALGPAGVAIGAIGTGIAESLDTVSSNQTISTAGTMTNAAAGI
jgi:hypothetical protein